MEKRNGVVGKEKGVSIYRSCFTGVGRYRPVNWLVVLGACSLVGCTTIKKAAVTSLMTAGGATVATALSGGVAATILGGTTGAFVGSAVSDLMITNPQSGFLKGKNMTNCAPDNFWTLLGSLVEMGGWLLLLLILVPMILGWILPGPLQRKKKD